MSRHGASDYKYVSSGSGHHRQQQQQQQQEQSHYKSKPITADSRKRQQQQSLYDSPATAGPPRQQQQQPYRESQAAASGYQYVDTGPERREQTKFNSPATAGPPMQHHSGYDSQPRTDSQHGYDSQAKYDSKTTTSGYQYTAAAPPKRHISHHDAAAPSTTVINIRKANLNKKGYEDLVDWLKDPNHVYIGRNMTYYVPGAVGIKWGNPFNAKKFGREECCKMYRDHVENDRKLMNDLWQLQGKVLGCWCHPEMCHGHVLAELVQEYC